MRSCIERDWRTESRLKTTVSHPRFVGSIARHTLRCGMSNRFWLPLAFDALVEAVCAEKRATAKDLEKRIDELVTLGVCSQPTRASPRLPLHSPDASERSCLLSSRPCVGWRVGARPLFHSSGE